VKGNIELSLQSQCIEYAVKSAVTSDLSIGVHAFFCGTHFCF
jgi:hypothetical protein